MSRRLHIPLSAKLEAALLMLGFTEAQLRGGIDWDHDPPLAMRRVDPETGELVPHANDPRFLTPRARAEHREKTAKRDIPAIWKMKRCAEANAEFNRRMARKAEGDKPKPQARKIPSRQFQRKTKKTMRRGG